MNRMMLRRKTDPRPRSPQLEPGSSRRNEATSSPIGTSEQPGTPLSLSHVVSGPSAVGEVLRAPRVPLDRATLTEMQPRFHADFSQVRVHASPQAGEAAESVNAQAFTVGNNIVFGDGRYDVSSTPGRELLAHELTYVVQQKHQEPSPDTVEIAAADSPFEHQAEIASTGEFSGHLTLAHSSGSAVLQRAPKKTDPPARKSELTALDKRVQALERRQSATTQDLHWRGLFGEKLSSWKQAVYRVAGGIDNARGGFTDAQVKQADFDALVNQISWQLGR
jgi:hypothetical protein